ncbi:uroporphyrinogen decarboxylase family protein [Aromatoleum bremense]|nr:uroporphyrinogen decarboxylase family protein [Aromatoleum bremense]
MHTMNDICETLDETPAAVAATPSAFDTRWQRIIDCVALKQPDRMPVAFYSTFWLARYAGITCRELMYDYEKTREIGERAVLEFDPDVVSPLLLTATAGPSLEAIGFKQLQWPGHGVGDDQPFQYLDREYMKADEYEDFIFDPTGYYLHTYLPRVASAFEGFEDLPYLPGLYYFRLLGGIRPFAKPRVREALEKVIRAAEEAERFAQHHLAFTDRLATLGYPCTNGTTGIAPYDFIADYFRGATGMMKDLYRKKDQLLALLDKVAVFLLKQIVSAARASGNPIVFIPVHWAPDAFMSPKQFETFWWPSFRRLLIGLIDAGLIPMPLWEADCTKRLEIIKDVPAGKCIYWFERTDMVKAFEVLGDVVALRGNLSPSMMTTGTPAEVDAAVRHLAENVFHKGGKLILDCAFGLPDEAPVDNVRAMFAAARKYAG